MPLPDTLEPASAPSQGMALPQRTMKAAVCLRYGPPDVVRIAEVERPRPGRGEVLIRVHAAGLNPLDAALFRGRPRFVRLVTGLRAPRTTRPGVDFAGVVAAVGPDVRRARAGDEVFGLCLSHPGARGFRAWAHHLGAFAEFLCVPDTAFATKPAAISFEEAAALPVAGLTALQGLRDHGRLEGGQTVLINGAAGGVGTLAVQIAQSFGAEVTGVCRTWNVDFVRSLGAHHVVDYTREDFTRASARYDVILDCVGNHSFAACRRALRPRGVCVLAGQRTEAGAATLATRMAAGLALSVAGQQKLRPFVARPLRRDLILLARMIEDGSLRPAIDRAYSLCELPEAIRYLEQKHAQGKVVVSIGSVAHA